MFFTVNMVKLGSLEYCSFQQFTELDNELIRVLFCPVSGLCGLCHLEGACFTCEMSAELLQVSIVSCCAGCTVDSYLNARN